MDPATTDFMWLKRLSKILLKNEKMIELDPDLFAQMPHWEKILTTEERRTASALCNTILPADANEPVARASARKSTPPCSRKRLSS